MIKRLLKRYNNKNIAQSYESYADYAHRASDAEKKIVIEHAAKEANHIQKELVNSL